MTIGTGRITHDATSPNTAIRTSPGEKPTTTPTPKATIAIISAKYPTRFAALAARPILPRRTTTGSEASSRLAAPAPSAVGTARDHRRMRLPLHFDEDTTHVMAVVNLSPESRIETSIATSPDDALGRARRSRDAGASIIDLGAQSSHFENRELDSSEEIRRIMPTLERLVEDGFTVSVDTWKPEVAQACVDAGAAIVNDTGGLADPAMRDVVRQTGVTAVLVHIEGENPLAVGHRRLDADQPRQIADALAARVEALRSDGITDVIVDPGLSINYRSDYDDYGRLQMATIRGLSDLGASGAPVLIPVPRKEEDHRMLAYLTLSIEYGADIIRVHEVEMACDLVRLLGAKLGSD